jgi:hypothetical protein
MNIFEARAGKIAVLLVLSIMLTLGVMAMTIAA